jgi:tetratricopeptide (TPR) repeat protein
VLLVLMAVILSHPKYLTLLLFSSELRGIHDNLISQIDGFSYLLSRLIFVNRLSIDPDIAAVTRMDLVMWVKVALLASGLSVSIMVRKTRPWLLFAFLWFFIALLPSNSIIARLDVVNERHLYLVDFGIFLALGCEAGRLLQGGKVLQRVVVGAAVAVFGVLIFFTVLRNNDYRSEVSLWESTVKLSPNKARGFNNLGCAYELAGLPVKATRAYETALKLDPLHETARFNLGRLKIAGVPP